MTTLKNILLTGLAALTLTSCGKSDLEQMAEIAQKVPELRLVKDRIDYVDLDGKITKTKEVNRLKGELTPKSSFCLPDYSYDDLCGIGETCEAATANTCTLRFYENLTIFYHTYQSEFYDPSTEEAPTFPEPTQNKSMWDANTEKSKLLVTLGRCRLLDKDEYTCSGKCSGTRSVIECNSVSLVKPKLDACWPEEGE